MPFLRYRTGDMGKLLAEPCPCGSFLRRMLPWGGRREGGGELWALDGLLLACPGVVDYSLRETESGPELTLFGVDPPGRSEAYRRLAEAGYEPPRAIRSQSVSGFSGTGMQKRSLLERSL